MSYETENGVHVVGKLTLDSLRTNKNYEEDDTDEDESGEGYQVIRRKNINDPYDLRRPRFIDKFAICHIDDGYVMYICYEVKIKSYHKDNPNIRSVPIIYDTFEELVRGINIPTSNGEEATFFESLFTPRFPEHVIFDHATAPSVWYLKIGNQKAVQLEVETRYVTVNDDPKEKKYWIISSEHFEYSQEYNFSYNVNEEIDIIEEVQTRIVCSNYTLHDARRTSPPSYG